jgi:hypothetical protein
MIFLKDYNCKENNYLKIKIGFGIVFGFGFCNGCFFGIIILF